MRRRGGWGRDPLRCNPREGIDPSERVVIELDGALVAQIELTKIDTDKKPGSDWRWELEWVDGSGNVSPIITDSKMTLLPSRAEGT